MTKPSNEPSIFLYPHLLNYIFWDILSSMNEFRSSDPLSQTYDRGVMPHSFVAVFEPAPKDPSISAAYKGGLYL
jgi:hypothetical protein